MAVIAYLLMSETFRYRSRYIVIGRLSTGGASNAGPAPWRGGKTEARPAEGALCSALDEIAGGGEVAGAADAQHRPHAVALSVPHREGAVVDRALDLLPLPPPGPRGGPERRPP